MIASIVMRNIVPRMQPRRRTGRAGVGDEFDRQLVHAPLKPALGDEAVAKARAGEVVGDAQPQAAGDHDSVRALREGDVTGDRAEAEAVAVEGGTHEAVGARQRVGPQRLFIAGLDRLALDHRQRLVDVGEAHAAAIRSTETRR
jgi:hypothetical protein